MPAAQDKCPCQGHSPNVRNRTWDSNLPLPLQLVSESHGHFFSKQKSLINGLRLSFSNAKTKQSAGVSELMNE